MNGGITTEKTVWCGLCAEWHQTSASGEPGCGTFLETIRGRGWKRTRKHGWLCPKCAKARV
jgi:hypothetical protein